MAVLDLVIRVEAVVRQRISASLDSDLEFDWPTLVHVIWQMDHCRNRLYWAAEKKIKDQLKTIFCKAKVNIV